MSRAREVGQQLAASYYGFDGFPVIIMSSSCHHHVTMLPSWHHHVIVMSSSCHHHVIIMSSCHHHVIIMPSQCHHAALLIPTPYLFQVVHRVIVEREAPMFLRNFSFPLALSFGSPSICFRSSLCFRSCSSLCFRSCSRLCFRRCSSLRCCKPYQLSQFSQSVSCSMRGTQLCT